MTAARGPIVVLGGGIAGQAVVEAVRERDRDVPLTLLCGEPRLPYDRVRLSELLALHVQEAAAVSQRLLHVSQPLQNKLVRVNSPRDRG